MRTVVRGAINAAWDKLGGSAAALGVPTDDESYNGDEVSQTFSGGQLTWNRRTNAFTTTPPELADQLAGLEIPGDVTTAIDAARRAAGGPLGPLGAVDGGQYAIGTDGTGQNYSGGKIFYSAATGADVLTGQVLAKLDDSETARKDDRKKPAPPQNPDEVEQVEEPVKEEVIQAADPRTAAWASLCQALFGSAEFRYIR